ncbi:hypothetical protein [Altericroceibacterium endophyticum]|uniref:Uncharacterized protein n=1 Tax=Altericroceibacterium endophyticum TaxID=1808508 RepID=A0A6I4SZU4_9SPHN|nr:hypothetical protein [Altericroceibacterium endophyticum]MXO64238.1 hypothetical protein [Altericroceibacterium endophyticum]
MYQVRMPLLLLPLLALSACGSGEGGDNVASSTAEAEQAPFVSAFTSRIAEDHIGPFSYHYNREDFVRTEIEIAVPPIYDGTIWGVKLIPAKSAAKLGNASCDYNHSGEQQTCSAAKEPGLTMALLERPISNYGQAFINAGFSQSDLPEISLMDKQGFRVTIARDGSETEYSFIPVEGRTLMLARQISNEASAYRTEIRDVMRSLKSPENRF